MRTMRVIRACDLRRSLRLSLGSSLLQRILRVVGRLWRWRADEDLEAWMPAQEHLFTNPRSLVARGVLWAVRLPVAVLSTSSTLRPR